MINNIKALAADIDMTLTAKGGDLPEVTIEAFQILHKHGVKLGLATGREIDEKLKNTGRNWGLGFEFDYIVGMNGGMVFDRLQNKSWQTDYLSIDEMKAILHWMLPLVDKYKIAVNAEGGGNHNAMYIGGELMESAQRHGFHFIDKTDDIDGFCEKPTFKFLFRAEPAYDHLIRSRFLEKFGDNYQIFGTYPGTVEIMHKGIDKGKGLQRYVSWNNFDMGEIIAFGDNENDDAMLKDAGWGVCLKNGSDGTKACADAVTEYDCEDGGVGHYMFDHFIKEKGWK